LRQEKKVESSQGKVTAGLPPNGTTMERLRGAEELHGPVIKQAERVIESGIMNGGEGKTSLTMRGKPRPATYLWDSLKESALSARRLKRKAETIRDRKNPLEKGGGEPSHAFRATTVKRKLGPSENAGFQEKNTERVLAHTPEHKVGKGKVSLAIVR